jgi:transcriptional regulator with XRE-family HTH domain
MSNTPFQKKELEVPKRVCFRLKECREQHGLTIADVAKRTKISAKYLEAMECCRFGDIPFGPVYQRNFIKRYAAAIGVPAQEFLDQYLREETAPQDAQAIGGVMTYKRRRSLNIPSLIRHILIVSAVMATTGYLGMQIKQSIEPPVLSVYAPAEGFVATAPDVTVHGSTEREAQVFINNEPIIINDQGLFEQRMYLSPGINTIIVSAKKKHGKTTTETRHVILKTNEELTRR